MPIDASAVATGIARARARMTTLEQELNEADAKLGDGDTGGMLARVIDRLATVPAGDADDLGRAFAAYAQAAMTATGSSLGTLFATALMAFAQKTKGQSVLAPADFGPALAAARDAMLKRGQSSLGDKTVIDAIDAVATAVDGKTEWRGVAAAARESAARVLAEFRDKPCRIGRARMFGDKSRGLDDPGMLAFVRLLDTVSGQGNAAQGNAAQGNAG